MQIDAYPLKVSNTPPLFEVAPLTKSMRLSSFLTSCHKGISRGSHNLALMEKASPSTTTKLLMVLLVPMHSKYSSWNLRTHLQIYHRYMHNLSKTHDTYIKIWLCTWPHPWTPTLARVCYVVFMDLFLPGKASHFTGDISPSPVPWILMTHEILVWLCVFPEKKQEPQLMMATRSIGNNLHTSRCLHGI